MESPFVNKATLGEYYLGRYDVYSVKQDSILPRMFLLTMWEQITITFYQIMRRNFARNHNFYSYRLRMRI